MAGVEVRGDRKAQRCTLAPAGKVAGEPPASAVGMAASPTIFQANASISEASGGRPTTTDD